jgi:hypothetical protein
VLVAAVVGLSVPQLVSAQSSALSGYSSPAGQIQAQVASPSKSTDGPRPPDATTTRTARDLPFTGLDLVLLFGVGLGLVALGLVLKRAVAQRAPQ